MTVEMKDSGIQWIGEIPEDWKMIKASRLYQVIGSGTTPDSNNSDYYCDEDGYNWLQTGDLNDGIIEKTSKHITELAMSNKGMKKYPIDSVVIAMYGATIGKVGIIKIETTVNQACCVLVPSHNIGYLYTFFFFMAAKRHLITLASGGGQPNISQAIIRDFTIPVPPLNEQQDIAKYLDSKCGEIDELLDLESQMIDELKAYKQSFITEAVTRGLNPNVPMRNSGIEWIGEIPQHWTIENLTKIIWLRARLGWRGLKAEEYVESGYPFLSAFNIVDNKLIWSDLNYITQERYDESPEIKLSEGDVLIVKDGAGIGKCARVDSLPCGEATVNSSLGVITPSERLNYAYLHYFLLGSTFQNMVLFLKNGMGVPHLTQENMKSVKIQLPPLNEQQEIAKYLDSKCADIDALIALREEKIDTLKEYKKSLIFEYVTGKKQVV